MSVFSEMGLGLTPEQMQIAKKHLTDKIDNKTKQEMCIRRKEDSNWYIEYHFTMGMSIRNILREVIKDNEIFFGWDEHYMDVVNAILDDFEQKEGDNDMSDFPYNMDNDLRLELIGEYFCDSNGCCIDYKKIQGTGGVLNFECLPLENLNALVEHGFVNLDDTQNEAPSIREFIEFANKYPNEDISFIGYAVLPPRSDYRISIEGLICETTNRDLIIDFILTFRHADDLSYVDDEVRCWYD